MANIAFPDVSMESLTCDLIWPGQRIHESVYTGSIQPISRGIGRWKGMMVFPAVSRTGDIPPYLVAYAEPGRTETDAHNKWENINRMRAEFKRTHGPEIARQLDAFFAAVDGGVNTFDVPWPVEARQAALWSTSMSEDSPNYPRVKAEPERTGSTMKVTLNRVGIQTVPAGQLPEPGLIKGDRISINGRMFTLVSDLSAKQTGTNDAGHPVFSTTEGECELSPYRPLTSLTADGSSEFPTAGLPINWTAPSVRARMVNSAPVTVQRNADWVGPWAAEFTDVL